MYSAPDSWKRFYERALVRELALRGVSAKAQVSFPVCYKGQYVGEYVADLLVGERLMVELKCVDRFANEHLAQCINYLKASGLRVAPLINFQKPRVVGNGFFWMSSRWPGRRYTSIAQLFRGHYTSR